MQDFAQRLGVTHPQSPRRHIFGDAQGATVFGGFTPPRGFVPNPLPPEDILASMKDDVSAPARRRRSQAWFQ